MPARRRTNIAIRDMKRFASTTEPLVRQLSFKRVVRRVARALRFHRTGRRLTRPAPDGAADFDGGNMKFQPLAFVALQEATEALCVSTFAYGVWAMRHAGRVVLNANDLCLVRRIRHIPCFQEGVCPGPTPFQDLELRDIVDKRWLPAPRRTRADLVPGSHHLTPAVVPRRRLVRHGA